MQIANPIYDVVFKYLLDDEKVAKLILSSIIDMEIEELEFRPTEHRSEINQSLTVFHLDFMAKVKKPDGNYNIVIIEIQKAKLPGDIMRFRRYLGEQYLSPKNITTEVINDKVVNKAIPIISIYFLGHKLNYTDAAIIKVGREYINQIDGSKIINTEEFIESLTHDSFVIQIPYLSNSKQSSLETILSLFDQENKDNDEHIININEDDYPDKYRPIIRRLLRAIAEPDIRKKMDIEDEVIRDFQIMERIIEDKKKEVEETKKEVEEKNEEVQKLGSKIRHTISELYTLNMSPEKIAKITNTDFEFVKKTIDELN